MFSSLRHLVGWIFSAFGSRKDLVLENLALRQQLLALHTKRPRRRLSARHKLFWVLLRKLWSGWQKPLILVTPRTVAWRGTMLAFGCIGNTFPEADKLSAAGLSVGMYAS
jgi:hypothetical protein